MVGWSQGSVQQALNYSGLDDINRRKVNPQKVVPGSLFPLAKTDKLTPKSEEERSNDRMQYAMESLGVVDNISNDEFQNGNSDYLKKAEDMMFRANQVSQQAAMLRLKNTMPVFKSGKINVSHTRQGGGGGGKSAKGNSELARLIRAIGGKESGNRYNARNGDSGAMGKYQIMPANIQGPGGWDKQILGRNITTQQFMNSPRLQEQIAQGMLTSYYRRYGAAGAASAWYSGSPTKWKTNGHGGQGAYPTIYNYVQSILRAIGK